MYDRRCLRMHHLLMHHRQAKELAYCQEISDQQDQDACKVPQTNPVPSFKISKPREWSVADFPREAQEQSNTISEVAGLRPVDCDNGIDDEIGEGVFALDL